MGQAFEQFNQDLQQYTVISSGAMETLYRDQGSFGLNGRDDYDYDADDYDSDDDDENDEDDEDDDEDFGFDDDDGGFNFDDDDEDSFGDEEE